jgi:hypothetical protein
MKRLTNVIDSYPQFSRTEAASLSVQSFWQDADLCSKADGTDIRQLTRLDFPARVPAGLGQAELFRRRTAGHSEISL